MYGMRACWRLDLEISVEFRSEAREGEPARADRRAAVPGRRAAASDADRCPNQERSSDARWHDGPVAIADARRYPELRQNSVHQERQQNPRRTDGGGVDRRSQPGGIRARPAAAVAPSRRAQCRRPRDTHGTPPWQVTGSAGHPARRPSGLGCRRGLRPSKRRAPRGHPADGALLNPDQTRRQLGVPALR